MVEIIHISDLHFGSEFVAQYMENIISYVEEVKPDAVICTGDVVHKGRVVQFESFLPFLNQIKEKFIQHFQISQNSINTILKQNLSQEEKINQITSVLKPWHPTIQLDLL